MMTIIALQRGGILLLIRNFQTKIFHAVTKLMRFKHCLSAMLDSSHMGAICWIEKKSLKIRTNNSIFR